MARNDRRITFDPGRGAAPDLSDPETLALFLELYGSLPRAAPGSAACTERALNLVPEGPRRTVLDVGCGPGAQTLSLAGTHPNSIVTAFDLLPPMVVEARRRCINAGLQNRVVTAVADMAAPPVAPASQDLVWCEGAVYNLGVTEALRRWRPVLRAGGCIGFSDAVWLEDRPADEIRRWWTAEYPAITNLEGVREAIAAAGYESISSFVLPAEAWWDDYYAPLERRLIGFLAANAGNSRAEGIAGAVREEISMFRRFGDTYSYAFFIVEPSS